jgi:riboflavin synthase
MFTGIVETRGCLSEVRENGAGVTFVIEAPMILEDLRLGDSVSVDGVCLTATALMENQFAVGVSPETLRRSNLGDRRAGDVLNLERAVLAGSRIGGHYVQGHVDQIGTIRERSNDGPALKLVIETPAELLPYIVEKGFIAVDGISLTVTGRGSDWFSIMLIPFTQQVVTLAAKPVGSTVNLEVDVMAKYVESLLEGRFDRTN